MGLGIDPTISNKANSENRKNFRGGYLVTPSRKRLFYKLRRDSRGVIPDADNLEQRTKNTTDITYDR